MRHRKISRRLTSTTEHRLALMRNQVRDLLKHGRITTTLPKAKELRRFAERMITLAKRGDLASRRRALAFLQDKEVVKKLFSELREKFLDRSGGYTRIIKIGLRRGDSAETAIVELVEEKVSFRKSKRGGERLKRLQEFIERKKKEYGLAPTESKEASAEEVSTKESEIEPEKVEPAPSKEGSTSEESPQQTDTSK
ncbi:50S ribosomal protein L17 [Caldimicrobium thiodismutans]|uniref:Large ribosomal subunit protein bL17 n=1 Tax=Caldimicrobium thiodismutans TaxID=1653476 RepID=A0A0U5AQ25_9BACT|nr:50S ribosomal protein L17 [Caldimicrobium thiodismutans]